MNKLNYQNYIKFNANILLFMQKSKGIKYNIYLWALIFLIIVVFFLLSKDYISNSLFKTNSHELKNWY